MSDLPPIETGDVRKFSKGAADADYGAVADDAEATIADVHIGTFDPEPAAVADAAPADTQSTDPLDATTDTLATQLRREVAALATKVDAQSTPSPAVGAGIAYAELIAADLAEERLRKTSLEGRGIAVITTSGMLLTLLAGIAAFIRGDPLKASAISPAAGIAVSLALALFIVAAIAGLMTNQLHGYKEATTEALAALTEPAEWAAPAEIGSRRVAFGRVNVLKAARKANDTKARYLTAALYCETGAVLLVALGVAAVIARF